MAKEEVEQEGIIPLFQSRKSHYSVSHNLIIPVKISLLSIVLLTTIWTNPISSGWVRLGDPLAGYLDGKMLANVLSNARNTLFDPLPQIQNYIIPLFQGNVIVDDYSKGNVVIPLFPKNQGHYSIIPLHKFPLFLFHYSSSVPDSIVYLLWSSRSSQQTLLWLLGFTGRAPVTLFDV